MAPRIHEISHLAQQTKSAESLAVGENLLADKQLGRRIKSLNKQFEWREIFSIDKKLPNYFDGKWGKKFIWCNYWALISVELEVADLTVDDES